jgi:putative transposase
MFETIETTHSSSEVMAQANESRAFKIGRHDAIVILRSSGLKIEYGLHRVVWANRKNDKAFLLRFPNQLQNSEEKDATAIEVSTGNVRVKQRLHMPTMVSLAVLEDLGNKRHIVKTRAPVPKRLNKQFDDPREFEKTVKTRRKSLVSTFMTDDDLIRVLEDGEMGRYVSRAVNEHNARVCEEDEHVTRYHVYQVVYRYWLHSCRESALIPDSGNCGAPGKYRNPGQAKRGRQPNRVITGHAPDKPGVNTGPEIRDLIWLYWDLYGGKIGQFAPPYRRMIEDHFTEGWKEDAKGNWVPDKETIADAPSLETFRYYVEKKYSPVALLKKLIPSIKWDQTKRALRGTAHGKLFGPAQTFMIDSTVADVYLVSQFNRYWIVGRPVVYFVRDVWSGMICGLHVALEGPSWHTARFALYNAFSPKGDFLRAHGFNMTDEDWPCAHGCLNLGHDRGESLSIPGSDSANDLGLILSPCPSFRPDLKGPIETLFHWVNHETVQWMPGAVHSRARERGERDYRLDATLTLQQFTRIIIHAILTFNRTADVRDRFDATMEEAGVKNNPISLWKWGLDNRNGSPPQWDRETLYNTLLPTGDAYVRPDGVYFSGKKYAGSYSDKAQWQEFARAFHNKKIKVKYDSVRTQEIYLLNEATGSYETLSLCPGQKIPANSRLEEILDQVMYRNLVKEDEDDLRMLDRIAHKKFRDQEIRNAEAAREAQVPPSTKAAHLANIKDKRSFEAAMQKIVDNARVGRGDTSNAAGNDGDQALTASSDVLSALLAKIAEEAANVAID